MAYPAISGSTPPLKFSKSLFFFNLHNADGSNFMLILIMCNYTFYV